MFARTSYMVVAFSSLRPAFESNSQVPYMLEVIIDHEIVGVKPIMRKYSLIPFVLLVLSASSIHGVHAQTTDDPPELTCTGSGPVAIGAITSTVTTSVQVNVCVAGTVPCQEDNGTTYAFASVYADGGGGGNLQSDAR
jgi:hypothetical protein